MSGNKTRLLAITGSSPAVVTETLYGMDLAGHEWPSDIKIITTTHGKARILDSFIKDQQIEKLCRERKKPLIPFKESDILVVTDAEGNEVDDARSLEDHEALANFIMTKVHEYTKDGSPKLHASIAGGRKTMTFYLGYAMSLFGRHFDRLSHVLVSDGYERIKDFYFPTNESRKVEQGNIEYDFKNAEITLADIPFIRQRLIMPKIFTEPKKDQELKVDFRNLVELINLGERKDDIKIEVFEKDRKVKVFNKLDSDKALAEITIKNLVDWCLYLLIIEESFKDEDSQGNYTRPKEGDAGEDTTYLVFEKLIKVMQANIEQLDDNKETAILLTSYNDKFWDHPKLNISIDKVSSGFGRTRFSNFIQSIKEDMEQALPSNLLNILVPKQIYIEKSDDNRRIRTGKGGDGYGVDLQANQITIIE